MVSHTKCFEDLITSFQAVCSFLERKAEQSLKEIEKECGEEFAESVKSHQRFDEIVSGINKTCSEVVNNSEILKTSTEKNLVENSISLPYEMHADVIKCISELYNLPPLGKSSSEERLINEKTKKLVDEFIKTREKIVHDVKDVENTIMEAKELL